MWKFSLGKLWNFQPKNISEVCMPTMYVHSTLGMGIFEYPAGKQRPILSLLYLSLLMGIYGTMVCISMDDFYNIYMPKSMQRNRLFLFYANVILAFSMTLFGWVHGEKLKMCVHRMGLADDFMENLGIPKKYKNLFRLQVIQFLLIFVVSIGTSMTNVVSLLNEGMPRHIILTVVIALYYPIVITFIGDLSFRNMIGYMGLKFQKLNDLLRGMSRASVTSPQHKNVLDMIYKLDENYPNPESMVRKDIDKSNESLYTLKATRQIHLELLRISRQMNKTYDIQILLSMGVCFFMTISILYNMYMMLTVTEMTKSLMIKEITISILWFLFYGMKIVMINCTCARTCKEAMKAGDIICELYEPSTSKEFRYEIQEFLLQLIQNPLTFTANGFFILDHSFIFGVIGSITTYLVILIQIGNIQSPATFQDMGKFFFNVTA